MLGTAGDEPCGGWGGEGEEREGKGREGKGRYVDVLAFMGWCSKDTNLYCKMLYRRFELYRMR